ncbi:MAG TPA: phage tail tape measure protein [Bellilinea sp.]|nr:phage tail tape measure protein [Bellilinea sp.]
MAAEIGIAIVLRNYSVFARNISNAQTDINRLQGTIGALGGVSTQLGRTITDVGQTVMGLGRTLTFALTVPLLGLTTGLVNAGIQFEDAFAGISRTVDGVADNFGNLTVLGEGVRNEIRNMALDIPIAANELSRIGTIAGQLGVQATPIFGTMSTELGYFTEVVAKMGATTDLSTEEAAFAFARMANIMGEQDHLIPFVDGLSNALVDLGNNAAATEPEIVNAAMRIAGAGRVVGLSTQEVLGFAASLAELGVRAEMGGTAVSRVMQEMFLAISEGVQATETQIDVQTEEGKILDKLTSNYNRYQQDIKMASIALESGAISQDEYNKRIETATGKVEELQTQISYLEPNVQSAAQTVMTATGPLVTFATIAGQSVEEFQRAFKEDAATATINFIERLAQLQDEGKITKDMLTELGLSGVRVRDVMNRMGGDMDLVRENIELANRAWEEQTALQIEFQKRAITVQSQLQLLKNQFKDLGITIFDLVKDDLLRLINSISTTIAKFKELAPPTQRTILLVAAVAAAIGPLLLALGGAITALGLFITNVGAVIGVVSTAIGWVSTFAVKIGLIASASTAAVAPVLAVAAAVAALVAALVAFTPLGDPIRDFLSNTFDNIKGKVQDFINGGDLPIQIPVQPVVEDPAGPAPATGPSSGAPYNVPTVTTVSNTERTARQAQQQGLDFGPDYQPYEPVDLDAIRAQVTEAASPDEAVVTSKWQAALEGIKGKIDGFVSEVNEIFSKFGTEGLLVRMGFGPNQAQSIGNTIDSIAKTFHILPETVSEVFQTVKDTVNEQIGGLFEGGAMKKIEVNWKSVWNTLRDIVVIVVAVIGTVVGVLLAIITGVISGLAGVFAVIIGVARVLGNAIAQVVEGIVSVFDGLIDIVKGIATGDWPAVWEGIKQVVMGVVEILKGIVLGIAAIVIGAFAGVLAFVAGFATGIFNFFSELWENLVGGDGVVAKIASDIGNFFAQWPVKLKEAQEKIEKYVGEVKTRLEEDIGTAIDSVLGFFTNLYDGAVEKISPLGNIVDTVKVKFEEFKSWLSSNIQSGFVEPFGKIGTKLAEVKDTAVTSIQDMWTELTTKAESIYTDVLKWFENLRSGAEEKFGDIIGTVDGITGAFISLKNWLVTNIGKILEPIGAIADKVLEVQGIISGSPELELQHMFERFEDYLHDTDFSMVVGTRIAPQTVSTVSSMAAGGSSINNVTNDNRIQVGDINSYGGQSSPGVSLMDTLRKIQSNRVT